MEITKNVISFAYIFRITIHKAVINASASQDVTVASIVNTGGQGLYIHRIIKSIQI